MRRAGFGASAPEIDALMTAPDWAALVDRVLDTSANPPDTIPAAVDDDNGNNKYYPAWVASVQYWMDRMATTPTPIVEKMTLFWHGHLTSSTEETLTRIVHRQIRTWRTNALGDVHTLMQAMAIDPAMLDYLDNADNVASSPNENFARELMELFTLGNGGFAESDVVPMARAWTGHGTNQSGSAYVFTPARHDNGSKTLFGIPRNWDGPATLTEIVRGSQQQVCARYLAAKIWSFFAYPNPDPTLVNQLGASLIAASMNIKAFLRVVFLRPEFRLASTRTALVRTPVEWLVATMRALEIPASELHPEWWMERLGQTLLQPPNVSGWRQNGAWISTSTTWGKASFAGYIRWKANDRGVFAGIDALTPAAAAQRAFDTFGIDAPATVSRQQLEAYVAREKTARRNWAIAPNLVALSILTPDFQLA